MDLKSYFAMILAGILWLGAGVGTAGSSLSTTSGLKSCQVSRLLLKGGTEIRDTLIQLKNPDRYATATIDRIQAFDEAGDFVYDSDAFGYPLHPEFVPVLEPGATARLYAADLAGSATGTPGAIRVYIHYRLDTPGRPLSAMLEQHIRNSDGDTFAEGVGYCSDEQLVP